jgi:hypothetical protein
MMRGGWSFLALLVAGLGLGGYVYFVESKRDASTLEKKDKVFTVDSDKIEEITVKAESGEQTTVRKSGTEWQIVKPLAAQPDSGQISGVASNLSSLEIQRVIDENPQDLGEYGLAQPRIEVTFKAGGQEHRLQVGRKTPPATDLYAKLADQKRVFLIPSYLESTFNKTTFDFRDKTVLKLDRDKIDKLAVTTPKRVLQFAKSNNEWQMTAPVKSRVDFSVVDGLVSRINTLQMKAIVAPEGGALAEYGLDKPEATVQLGSGSSQATLLIGKPGPEGTVHAKDESRPAVITIESALLADLTKEPGEYRQKDLFDARTFNATRLEILRAGQTAAFEKTKTKNKEGQDEEKWRQVAPTARDVDQTKVENLVSAVTGAQATGFVDTTAKTGLDKPELTVTIKSDEGKKEEKVAISRGGADGYALRAGEPGAAKVAAATIDNIIKALDALK